ncbi:MAG TPA: DUF1489 domain-containing protein [Parvularculaceae bacterium]|nr:DUF1489 domain-containing protein [Parvularculaceae bacterium]
MTVHLVKLCVGADSVEDVDSWVKRRAKENAKGPWGRVSHHVTRMFPRRIGEVLGGGSLYWVIKGVVLVRQKIVGLEKITGEDGIERCAILLDPTLVETEAQPRRAFQGWRYLRPEDAPADLKKSSKQAPPGLRAELAELGLL